MKRITHLNGQKVGHLCSLWSKISKPRRHRKSDTIRA